MEISEQHFTEDPESLEDFVLGRLDPETQARRDKHLSTCETCRQAVHVERVIAAGSKRAGRERLKERIGMLAGISPRRQIPWPHVLSVAAILLILLGIGIYQRWFVTHIEPKDVVGLERPELESKGERATPQASDEQVKSSQVTTRSSETATRQRDMEKSLPAEGSTGKGRDEKLGYARAPDDRLEESASAISKDKRRADVAQPTVAAAGGQQVFWANGTLITERLSKKEADEGKMGNTIETRATQAADAPRAKIESFGHITIAQQPSSKLPASQLSQQLYSQQTIQTLVRQSEGETQLTLYPGSLFDSTQLHFARVQQVSPDSLIVQIGSQQIGYRFPPGTMQQTHTESAKPVRK